MTILIGGGGSGLPVNFPTPMYVGSVDLYVAPDGSEYLKSGKVLPNVGDYPDATQSKLTEWDGVAGQSLGNVGVAVGIHGTTLGGFYYLIDANTDEIVHQYNPDWTPTGTTYPPYVHGNQSAGMTTDAAWFYTLHGNEIKRFTLGWVFDSTLVNIALTTSGIAFNGVNLRVLITSGGVARFRDYNTAGVQVGSDIFLNDGEPIIGITNSLAFFGGNYFIKSTDGVQHLIEVAPGGALTGVKVILASNTNAILVHPSNGSIATVNAGVPSVGYDYTTTTVVGMQTAAVDAATNEPVYVKVK